MKLYTDVDLSNSDDIDASNLVIDLNGHTLTTDATGEDLFDGDNVTILNGTVVDGNGNVTHYTPAKPYVVAASVPTTGDNTPIALLACLLLLSGCAIITFRKRYA